MQRINYASETPWEEIIGYSRAVKIGNVVEVTGTVATDENNRLVGKDSAYEQAKYILHKIEKVLEKAGSSLKDVVRTRIYVTDISKWQDFGKAHGEVFKDIKPCTTLVEVRALISPEYLIEIEATAVTKTT